MSWRLAVWETSSTSAHKLTSDKTKGQRSQPDSFVSVQCRAVYTWRERSPSTSFSRLTTSQMIMNLCSNRTHTERFHWWIVCCFGLQCPKAWVIVRTNQIGLHIPGDSQIRRHFPVQSPFCWVNLSKSLALWGWHANVYGNRFVRGTLVAARILCLLKHLGTNSMQMRRQEINQEFRSAWPPCSLCTFVWLFWNNNFRESVATSDCPTRNQIGFNSCAFQYRTKFCKQSSGLLQISRVNQTVWVLFALEPATNIEDLLLTTDLCFWHSFEVQHWNVISDTLFSLSHHYLECK